MGKKIILFVLLFVFFVGAYAGNKKTYYRNALVLAYSQANSVYEDDNIKLEIYDEQLWATNKTTKTIFIDLSQCFLLHNGSSRPLVGIGEKDKKAKKEDKKASKKGVSSSDDIYITIAPAFGSEQKETFICNMSTYVYGNYSTYESPSDDFSDYDKRFLGLMEELITESGTDKSYKGTASRHLTEDESINIIGTSIAYAFNKKAEEWTNVSLSTWVSDVIFAPFYVEMPKDLEKKEKRGFAVKETSPAIIHIKANSPFEFDEDKSPIIVCDWEGKYKKGTFSLGSTWISKTKKPSVLGILGAVFTYGATLINSFKETSYKKVIHFDGKDSDWGDLHYANSVMTTKQKN